MQKLVVFDTGTGGRIFANHLRQTLKNIEIIEIIDSVNSPYGEKSIAEIQALIANILAPFLGAKNTTILLACNTATTTSINFFRKKYPEQLFIGAEPMLKPASLTTKNRCILVLATKATFNSNSYQQLKKTYCKDILVLEPDTSQLALLIDQKLPTKEYINQATKTQQAQNPDTIVLACTHYLAIQTEISQIFPDADILSPLEPITHRIKNLLSSSNP